MIKRYDFTEDGMESDRDGDYVRFTDHESDKAAALEAKDAEIAELKKGIQDLMVAFGLRIEKDRQAIAEQVRQRCAHVAAKRAPRIAEAIHTADLTDLISHVANQLAEGVPSLSEIATWLDEAADDVADWGGYVDDYFTDKHDLAGDIQRYRDHANSVRAMIPSPPKDQQ